MARKPKVVDALSPLDAVTTVFIGIVLTFLALGTLSVIFTDGASMFEMDRESVCVDANFSIGNDAPLSRLDHETVGLGDDVTVRSGRQEVCKNDPGVIDLALKGLTNAPAPLVFLGFLLLTRRTIAYARRHGLFSAGLAHRVERLGWLLLLGLVGAAVIGWLASGQLERDLLPGKSWVSGSFDVSVAGIIGAYGIISVGRVMARAAALQDDADATI